MDVVVNALNALGMVVGVISATATLSLTLYKMRHPERSSWLTVLAAATVALIAPLAGRILGLVLSSVHALAGDAPTVEPGDPSPTPPPVPVAASKDPIVLPEIQNLGTLWTVAGFILAAVIIGAIIFTMLRAIRKDRRAQELEAAERERIRKRWQEQVEDVHNALRAKMVAAETDWDMLFTYPALSDTSYRATRNLHQAARAAELAATDMPADFDERTPLDSLPYMQAITALDKAWGVALKNAKKVGLRKVSDEERRTIGRIRTLLTIAEGAGASAADRDTAYAQIQKLVGKLPQRATLALEKRTQLALTS